MKKKLVLVMAMAMALCLAVFALAGCGGSGSSAASSTPSDEELIAADMEKNVEAFKSGLQQGASGIAESSAGSTLEMLQIDPQEFADILIATIDAKTGKIAVNGNEATAELIVTVPDFTQLSTVLEDALNTGLESVDLSTMSQDEAYAAVGKIMMDTLKQTTIPTNAETVEVKYAKTDGKWAVTNLDEIQTELTNAFNNAAASMQ